MGWVTNAEDQMMGNFKKIEKLIISNHESHIIIDLDVHNLLDATAVTKIQLEAFKTKVKTINNQTERDSSSHSVLWHAKRQL